MPRYVFFSLNRNPDPTIPSAPLGRKGCDTPLLLLHRIISLMKEKNPDIEAIFVPGDMVGHGIAEDLSQRKGNYTLLRETL